MLRITERQREAPFQPVIRPAVRQVIVKHLEAGLRGPQLVAACYRDALSLSWTEQPTGKVCFGPLHPDSGRSFDPDELVACYIEKEWSTGSPLHVYSADVLVVQGEWFPGPIVHGSSWQPSYIPLNRQKY